VLAAQAIPNELVFALPPLPSEENMGISWHEGRRYDKRDLHLETAVTDDPVILVTGGASGLGAAAVGHFARKGWGVTMNYRDQAKADALFAELEQAGAAARVLKVRADVTDRTEVRQMFDDTVETFGKVDFLINCAGFNRDAPFLEMTDELWDSVVGVHLKGTFICCQEYVFHNSTSPGHIINLGATCGLQGRKNGVNFCSAKGGILALTKCLAQELAPRIQVNCLIPGQVDTPEVRTRYHLDRPEELERVASAIPMGRIGALQDVTHMADSILQARFTTGACFFVNGGDLMH
jgi:NAD(P)-dependent dehydrogenase (short-subunit alcohol dehydrogenase family)